MPASVRARGWCRVDLAGGTLDIWPLGLFQPSQTVNCAVDLAVEVRLQPSAKDYSVTQAGEQLTASTPAGLMEDVATALVGQVLDEFDAPPIRIDVTSASPRGGGLGASSALAVCLIAGLRRFMAHPPGTPAEIAELARDIEARLMRLPTGTQDHFPALLGGTLSIEYRAGGVRARHLDVNLDELGEHMIVVFSGVSHFSAGNNWSIVRRALDGDSETNARLAAIAEIAAEMVPALERGDWELAGSLLSAEWDRRVGLAAEVSNSTIDRLMRVAADTGAWGGKACGAGGGGCLAFLAPGERRSEVENALREAGARLLPCRPVATPMELEIAD